MNNARSADFDRLLLKFFYPATNDLVSQRSEALVQKARKRLEFTSADVRMAPVTHDPPTGQLITCSQRSEEPGIKICWEERSVGDLKVWFPVRFAYVMKMKMGPESGGGEQSEPKDVAPGESR